MDRLHGVLKTLGVESKSVRRRAASLDHLGVFREFLNHLDRIQHHAPAKPSRMKTASRKINRRARKV